MAYHFGVMEVLEDRGFVLRAGFRDRGQPRETGPPGIDLAVGSSAGAFFVTAACAGLRPEDLVGTLQDGATPGSFEPRFLLRRPSLQPQTAPVSIGVLGGYLRWTRDW